MYSFKVLESMSSVDKSALWLTESDLVLMCMNGHVSFELSILVIC